jgi:ABC-type Fe3+ transport system substrate-binding protein
LFENATYDAKLAVRSYPIALAEICDALVSKFAQDPDEYDMGGGTGGGKAVWRERIKAWKDLAKLARSGKIDTPSVSTRRSRAAVALMTAPDLSNLEDQRIL